MVTYLPRSAWKARAARGSTALLASEVVGIADHWPGMSKPINATGTAGQARVASALRGWQNYHMDGRGWSDIAYLVAVDQAGRAWTLRGLNNRSGANGDGTVNRKYGACLLILGPGEEPSAAMIKTAKGVHADFKKRFSKSRVRPYGHQEVRAKTASGGVTTDCPGPKALAAIHAGKLDAGTVSVPPVVPTKPPTKPGINPVSLSALQYHAKNGTGKYSPASSAAVVNGVKTRLVGLGCGSAANSFRTCYREWQRKLGYTGSAADGIPGAASLKALAARSNWTVVA